MMEYKDYLAFCESLISERDQYKGDFERSARMVLPTAWAAMQESNSNLPAYVRYCEEANTACQLLASAHMQMLTPFDSRWFNIDLVAMGSEERSDEAEAFQ